MKIKKPIASFLTLMLICWQSLGLAQGLEEVPYDEVLQDLNRQIGRKTYRSKQNALLHPEDSLMVSTRLGYAHSLWNIEKAGKARARFDEGIEVLVGTDLFSSSWAGEMAFRNFGTEKKQNEETSLREFDIRLVYLNFSSNQTIFRLVNGFGARYSKYLDKTSGFAADDSTPVYLLGGGLDFWLTKKLVFGLEASTRIPLINESVDRGSVDLSLQLGIKL